MGDYGRILEDGFVEIPQRRTVNMRISEAPERELYAKFSDGTEKKLTGVSSNQILNSQFDPSQWTETDKGPSRSSITSLINSLGKYSRTIIIDSQYGNDFTATPPQTPGERENILRPFKTLSAAMSYSQQGDVIIINPGTYTITGVGLSPKDNQTIVLINAALQYSGSNSAILSFPFTAQNVKFIGIGNSSITKTNSNGWGVITPYQSATMTFENLTISDGGSSSQIVSQLGSFYTPTDYVKFIRCKLINSDNQVNPLAGGGLYCPVEFQDCEVTGMFVVAIGANSVLPYPMIKAVNTNFYIDGVFSNGYSSNFVIINGGANINKFYSQACNFKSSGPNISTVSSADSLLIIKETIFENGVQGWIENNGTGVQFKLIGSDNFSTNNSTGTEPVVNLCLGSGVITDPNVEVVEISPI
jgi:hypothetical protein